MSAEPGRRTAYSINLRWRIVYQRIGMNLSLEKIASNLNVSTSTAYALTDFLSEQAVWTLKAIKNGGKIWDDLMKAANFSLSVWFLTVHTAITLPLDGTHGSPYYNIERLLHG